MDRVTKALLNIRYSLCPKSRNYHSLEGLCLLFPTYHMPVDIFREKAKVNLVKPDSFHFLTPI